MKAPAFDYLRPDTLDACLAALAELGDDAQVLAGGQSLMPMLNFRLAAPATLIDIGRLAELKPIRIEGDRLVVGARATHAEIAASAEVHRLLPLLAAAAPHIAHVAIRNRGTIGGSVALADPASEWAACALALDAEIELASTAGRRRVAAEDYFLGLYATDRRADELVTAIRFPIADAPLSARFDETSRRRGDFAIAGLAMVWRGDAAALRDVRIALLGVGDRPVLARAAMAALEGARAGEAAEAAVAALADELAPPDDPAYPSTYRVRVAQSLLRRSLAAIAERPDDDR